MEIVRADPARLPEIMQIYAQARQYMAACGNPDQWINGYPSESIVRADMEQGFCRMCVENGEILGVFCFFIGQEPTYRHISGGKWLNDRPYGVIHRVAVRARHRGVASACLQYGLQQCGNLKIDTHRDNLPMQKMLEKNGFVRCGTVCLEDGSQRIAYQKADP